MMRLLIVLAMLASALPAHAADNWWTNLWHNADQRGEALMQQGDAVSAAKVYGDPRRKAYATLMSGDYAKAAQDLKAFDDSDANYNRGNALAHAGDLKGALDAYDAALKRDPNNKDARHNRDLVANALKQKNQPQQNASGKQSQDNKSDGKNSESKESSASNQDGKSGKGSQRDKGDQGGPGQQNPSSASGRNGKNSGQSQSSASPQGQTGKAGQENKSPGTVQSGAAQNAPGNTMAQQGNLRQSGANGSAATPDQKDSAEQARRDAAASLGKAAPGAQENDGASTADANGALGDGTAPHAAPSEKQLAQDQWLRSIPDDPGGLLRRKFLVEYMMRHKGAQP